MKLSVLALAIAILSLAFGAQPAPLSIGAPAHDGANSEAQCGSPDKRPWDGYTVPQARIKALMRLK